MDATQVKLELQVAHQWAMQGNLERTILHIELAQKYLEDERSPTLREADSQALKLLRALKSGVPQKGTIYYENLMHRIDAILENA